MRYAVGCDLVEVARIKKAAERESFCRHAFSKEEMLRFSNMKFPYESMAGVWAAKEAFAKALGTGVRGFSLNEITVAHDELGAPFFKLVGRTADAAAELEFSLSISHTKDYAQAFCIACRKE
jgi:holo-[acyl-carrier protein] synthase